MNFLHHSRKAAALATAACLAVGIACAAGKRGRAAGDTTMSTAVSRTAPAFAPATATAPPTAVATATDTTVGHHFNHVVIIVLENEGLHSALAVPYFAELAKQGAWFSNYHGVGHPSYPNYLGLIAGSTYGFTSDKQGPPLHGPTIADQLEAHHLTWKQYAEDYPGHCFTGSVAGSTYLNSFAHGIVGHPYARKHVPFMSFASIQDNPTRCARVVDGAQFMRDARGDSLPNYSFYTPNMRNDGHDTPIAFAANWLDGFLKEIRALPVMHQRTLIVVTFDEGIPPEYTANTVLTVMLGDNIAPGEYTQFVTHYGLLRTIEDNFDLSPVAAGDRDAAAMPGAVWKK